MEEENQLFEVRELLWEKIQQQLPSVEWEEAKSIIQEGLIEKNEELKREILSLLEMWKAFQKENNQQEQNESLPMPIRSILPEPPHIRERLEKEISFFIEELSKRKNLGGKRKLVEKNEMITRERKNSSEILLELTFQETEKDKSVYDYMMSKRSLMRDKDEVLHPPKQRQPINTDVPIDSRPQTRARSRSGSRPSSASPPVSPIFLTPRLNTSPRILETINSNHNNNNNNNNISVPLLPSTINATLSVTSLLTPRDNAVSSNNDYYLDSISDCVKEIRVLLEEERQNLLGDIEFLTQCLEDQALFNDEIVKYKAQTPRSFNIPSLQDMRNYSSKLSQQYLSLQTKNPHSSDLDSQPHTPQSQTNALTRPSTPHTLPAISHKTPLPTFEMTPESNQQLPHINVGPITKPHPPSSPKPLLLSRKNSHKDTL